MDSTPIYDFVIDHLEKSKGGWTEIASLSGVPKRTLEKIARKEIENPGVRHIQKLYDFFTRTSAIAEVKRAA